MKNFSPKYVARLLAALTFLLALTSLPALAQTTPRHSRGLRRLPTPARSLPALDGPINSSPMWCEWQKGSDKSTGMVTMTPEFTRATPQNGWVAVFHNTYQAGGRVDQNVQLFNSRPAYSKPRTSTEPPRLIGTDWDFQTVDGRTRCKVFVSTSKGEVRFSECSNGNSQYCVTKGLFDGLIGKTCATCSSGDILGQSRCLARCMDDGLGGSGASSSNFCEQYPVSCLSWMTVRFIKRYPAEPGVDPVDLFTAEQLAAAAVDRQRFIKEVLRAMYQGWINFVNSELGPCTTSHFCPAGTNCNSRGVCVTMFGVP